MTQFHALSHDCVSSCERLTLYYVLSKFNLKLLLFLYLKDRKRYLIQNLCQYIKEDSLLYYSLIY